MTTGTTNTNEYIELLKKFPPRLINSEEELLATQKVMDSPIDSLIEDIFTFYILYWSLDYRTCGAIV